MTRALLVVPHFWDPVCVPLGVASLRAYARRAGHEVTLFDFNTVPEVFEAQRLYFDEVERQLPEWRQWNIERNGTDVLAMHQILHLHGRGRSDYHEIVAEVLNVAGAPLASVAARIDPARFDAIFATLYARVSSTLQRLLSRVQPEVVGCSLFNSTWPATLFILRRAKVLVPGVRTAVGGPGPILGIASSAEEVAAFHAAHDFIDYYVVGEGESQFLRVLEEPALPRGVFGGEGPLVRLGGSAAPKPALAELPDPDYGELDVGRYLQLSLASSRGCPFECSFCAETVFWRRFRKVAADDLADQMGRMTAAYRRRSFYLCDSLANPVIDGLATALLDRRMSVEIDCYLRADRSCVDAAQAARWHDAGLFRARLGLESASQRILDDMVKKTDTETMGRATRALAQGRVRTSTLWIVGYPHETASEFEDTIDFLREHRDDVYDADAWLFQYHPAGLAGSAKLDGRSGSRPRFSPELTAISHVHVSMIEDGLSAGDRCERLARFVSTMRELGIPNPYSMDAWRAADARWRDLGHHSRPGLDAQ